MKNPTVLYFGPYLDEAIKGRRGLSTVNAAGTNRMSRLAQAMSTAGFKVTIVSPGISLRAGKRNAGFWFPTEFRHSHAYLTIYLPTVNFPFFNTLFSGLCQIYIARLLIKRHQTHGVIIYNFNIGLVILATYLKLFHRKRLLHNIEDIPRPRLTDLIPRSKARPVQEAINCVCQLAITWLSDACIIPTRRFIQFLRPTKPKLVVTGCISPVKTAATPEHKSTMRVLFSGKIDRENGIVELLDALSSPSLRGLQDRFVVDICGAGDLSDWVKLRISTLALPNVNFRGFVDTAAYQSILISSDICLALQNPGGRNAEFKTPSKFYEYLGYGKAVIATDVGDLMEIDGHAACILKTFTPDTLGNALVNFIAEPDRVKQLKIAAYNYTVTNFSTTSVGEKLRALILP